MLMYMKLLRYRSSSFLLRSGFIASISRAVIREYQSDTLMPHKDFNAFILNNDKFYDSIHYNLSSIIMARRCYLTI